MGRLLRSALPIVGVALLAAACASSPTGNRSAPAVAPSHRGATTPATPSATARPATVYRCQTDELKLTVGRALGSAGRFSQSYLFTNITGQPCGLTGYPGLQMLDADGGPLRTRVVPWGSTWPNVTVAPGGVASFEAMWQNGFGYATPPPSCELPAGMEVTPPAAFGSLEIDVQGMEVCANGQIEVSSVVSGSDPEVYLPG